MSSAISKAVQRIEAAGKTPAPTVDSFSDFMTRFARVRRNDGSYTPYTFHGREPLIFVTDLISKIIRNCMHGEAVEIDGAAYKPGSLKGSTVSICGGAQFGKTVLELNLCGYMTTIEFLNFGYYTPDQELLQRIVDSKFRPDVVDQVPWIQEMITLGKAENASGKTVNRKNSFQVSGADRKAFGHFCGMQKPPTTISLDMAVLDEVDDIPARNIGFVDGRMTNSPLHLTCFIGTQRKHATGQNERFEAGTQHFWMVPCSGCGAEWHLTDQWPGVVRIAMDGAPKPTDPKLREEMEYDADADYYFACPECGTPLHQAAGTFRAQRPERARVRNWSLRIAQFDCVAISAKEQAAAWFASLKDPSGEAISAFWCDRAGKPRAGAAQPITPTVLDRARLAPEPYNMALAVGGARVAGMDTGPRCWLWVDEIRDEETSPMVWAEMIASGKAVERVKLLQELLGISCVFIDAGGEPELTKNLVLALNGLDTFTPPVMPIAELRKQHIANIGAGVTWNPAQSRWYGIRAAAVAFSLREAGGIVQDVGVTVDGKIYPLIKCNRAEAIQTAVNDFLTPADGFTELVKHTDGKHSVRQLPRARLPVTHIGIGASQSVVDGHLMNLRRERDPRTGEEDWVDQVENHLGLAKVYARLASMHVAGGGRQYVPMPAPFAAGRRSEAMAERGYRGVLA